MTCAAYYGHTDVIKELIENGADVNLVSDDVEHQLACWFPQKLLVSPENIQHRACLVSVLRTLCAATIWVVEAASMVHSCRGLQQVRMDGTSPLWLAANAPDDGGEAAALELLEAGAKADIVGSRGGTALHGAAFHGRAKLGSALIAAGCPVNAVNSKTSYTALHTAAETKHPKVWPVHGAGTRRLGCSSCSRQHPIPA
jgi:ankyrin repeat protein